MEEKFSLVNNTKDKIPLSSLLIEKIKNDILGKNYSLSIAFVNEEISKKLNSKYRNKNKSTNVLSFSLKENFGELILCPKVAQREAKKKLGGFGKTYTELLKFLVIHGMLHLKGHEHSSTMDKSEEFYCEKYDQKYYGRNRRRLENDASRGGRVLERRKKS